MQGMVLVLLHYPEGKTLLFQQLCSGEKGPSYAGTRMLGVVNDTGEKLVTDKVEVSRSFQKVYGGDYEHNDGTGGPTLPGLEEKGIRVVVPMTEGLVVCYDSPHHPPSQFSIYTAVEAQVKRKGLVKEMAKVLSKSPYPQANINMGEDSVVGQVIMGMDVLKDMAKLPDIKAVTVTECGLALKFPQ